MTEIDLTSLELPPGRAGCSEVSPVPSGYPADVALDTGPCGRQPNRISVATCLPANAPACPQSLSGVDRSADQRQSLEMKRTAVTSAFIGTNLVQALSSAFVRICYPATNASSLW